ncbi:MAG TPA: aldo/keto reductase [Candidatus Hydrogenedentes bacterium]|nr:MAG: General stress protein 69 [Candidatus Hydrogenedentes bacterium ADurb.Bin170]HNZ47906.1 aldo/keto reductase [Candidatus Hydrogenedentota bacterium]HOD94292.1 aldo/keto reductase [Candidatus Hydrogenedentota bacterium]HOM48928.1 aldo/keto reductase [Candidatus Hydrogenedentota bacterium]HOR49952.1 aldo/keto reductase [Candidatus Hydrogenedentota bacterium]
MKYVQFGSTGLEISEICLGTMTFGNEADEAVSFSIMDYAASLGINFFDCAHNYNKGLTEEIVGRWLKGRRDEFILATKVFFPYGGGRNDQGLSRRNILASLERSLRRLQTDYVDILYLHHWDENCSLESSLAAVNTLVEQGKVHYLGISNFSAWQVATAMGITRIKSFAPVSCIQPMYSLVKRQAEVELLPLAEYERLAVFPYNVIGAGLLTGKYLTGGSGRLKEAEMYRQRYANPQYEDVTRRFIAYASQKGYSPAALAAAWVKSHPSVSAPIIGARTIEQLQDTLGCLDIVLDPEERAALSALSPEPPHATDREPLAAMKSRGW